MIITGNIGRDVEKKTAQSGREYLTFTVAESWGKEDRRVTNWFSVAFYGKPELLAGFAKGVRVKVDGDLKVNVKDGKPYLDLMSLRAELAPFVPREGAEGQPAAGTKPAATGKPATPPATQGMGVADNFGDDDIPF